MTIFDYITKELIGFDLVVNEAELSILIKEAKLNPEASLETVADLTNSKKVIVKYIPSLLLRPNITEGGFSISYNREGILQYYRGLCSELGLEPKVSDTPKVTDRSNIW